MKKQNFVILIIAVFIFGLFISILYYNFGFKKQFSQKLAKKIEIVEDINNNLYTEFNLKNNEDIISPKYKLTCYSEKCTFDVPFNTSIVPALDITNTKIYLKINNGINVVNHFSHEIDDLKNKIYFEIFNYQAPTPLELTIIVVYNPNMGGVISR